MSVTIDRASRKVVAMINSMERLTKAGIEHAGYISGKGLVRATSQEILRRPKRGRTYIRRDRAGRRRRHIASAPGETHANRSGRLRRSLGFKVSASDLEFGYGVSNSDAPDYAEFVEFGTRLMKPRPSLENGIKNQQGNFEDNFEREIGKRIGFD